MHPDQSFLWILVAVVIVNVIIVAVYLAEKATKKREQAKTEGALSEAKWRQFGLCNGS